MSMYRDLLAASMDQGSAAREVSSSAGELLAHLIECRRALETASSQHVGRSVDDLALHIDYDLALVRMCSALGIECEPKGFEHPLHERRRLERELVGQGVDITALEAQG